MSVRVAIDLRPQFGPARDQGKRPTCLAFATSDAHAALRGAWQALSTEFAFYHAQRRGKRKPSEGATLPSILEAILVVLPANLPNQTGRYQRLYSLSGDRWTKRAFR
jgi:hypothetical protein